MIQARLKAGLLRGGPKQASVEPIRFLAAIGWRTEERSQHNASCERPDARNEYESVATALIAPGCPLYPGCLRLALSEISQPLVMSVIQLRKKLPCKATHV